MAGVQGMKWGEKKAATKQEQINDYWDSHNDSNDQAGGNYSQRWIKQIKEAKQRRTSEIMKLHKAIKMSRE
jgi:hypothetical protein